MWARNEVHEPDQPQSWRQRWPVDRGWILLRRAWGNGAGRVRNDVHIYAWICTTRLTFQKFPKGYKWLACIELEKFEKTCIHETHHSIILRDGAIALMSLPVSWFPTWPSHAHMAPQSPVLLPSFELYQGMKPPHQDWGAQRNRNYHGSSKESKVKGAPNYFNKSLATALLYTVVILLILALQLNTCARTMRGKKSEKEWTHQGSVFGAVCVEVNILGFWNLLNIS